MKSYSVLIVLVIFFTLLAGLVFWATRRSGSAAKKEFVAVSTEQTPTIKETRNPKYFVRKNEPSNDQTIYTVRGTILTAPKDYSGLYAMDIAIEGDEKKVPVRVMLAQGASQINFADLDTKGQLPWKMQKVSQILSSLKTGTSIEVRVVVAKTDAEAVKSLVPPMEALLQAKEITPTTYSIQPQMVATL
jgi:hypothetical protein